MPEHMKAPEPPFPANDENQRAAQDQPGERASDTAADQPQRGQAETPKDERPAQKGVDRDSGKTQPQHDARALEHGDEIAQQLEQQPGSRAPHVSAQEGLTL